MPAKSLTWFLVAAGMLLFPSCKEAPWQTQGTPTGEAVREGRILARVDGQVITVEEFQEELAGLPEYSRKRMEAAGEKKKYLNRMIDRVLLLEEAQKRGLDKDPEILRKVERYRTRLITEKLYGEVAKERGEIGEEQIRKYYEDHKDRFSRKERLRLRQILILAPSGAGPEKEAAAKKKAEEALGRIRAGEDFEEVVKAYSEGPAASRGGDLGYLSRGRMAPKLEEAAFSLKQPGDTTGLVRTPFGFHILQLVDRQPAKELSLDEVRDRIIRQLKAEKRREIRRTLAKELREGAKIEVYEELLEGKEPAKG